MTTYRRLTRIVLVLTMVLSLLPVGLFAVPAMADTAILGKTTIHKVNVRVGASNSAKLLFQIPEAGYVGTLKGEKTAEGILWYKVEFKSPEPGNDRYYTGYMKAEFFTVLTEEEAAQYKMGDYIATPTPIPETDPETGATPTPTPTPAVTGSVDAPAGTLGVITNSGVNLRKGPSTSFGVITQLNRGDVVTVLTIPTTISESTFYFVRYGDTEGFIMSTFLRLSDDPNTTVPPAVTATPTPVPASQDIVGYVMTTKGGVNLRQTPGGTVITTVGKNRTFPLLLPAISKNGYKWYFVQAGEYKGYLRGDCVKEVGEPAPTSTGSAATATPTPTPTPAPTSSDATGYLITTAGGLNLRKAAGYTDVLGQEKKGVVLPYFGTETVKGILWYRIYHPKYGYCYVHSNFVKKCNADGSAIGSVTPTPTPTNTGSAATATPTPTPTPAETPTGYLKTTSGGLNLRKAAGYTDVLGQLSKGVVLPYYGEPTTVKGVKWYRVKDSKYGYGYLHASYVTPVNSDGSAIATPTPSATTIPGSEGKAEASYNTLRLGSSGNAVKNLTTELINQGYMTGSPTTKYTSAVESAVKKFQEAKNLTVDGIAGSATQHALYGTVPIGSGDVSNLSMTLYPAEKIEWSEMNDLWARGSNYKVYDVKTGIVWWAHRWAGGLHADVEPLTAADTARICKMYNVNSASQINSRDHWQRRPSLVTIGTRTFACSLYGVPHNDDGDTIADNNMTGQICIHFTNSKIHGTKKVDSGHQDAIEYAWEHAPNGHK